MSRSGSWAALEDRGDALRDAALGWRELLLALGRVDEAERFALAARETVGPHDISSLATTTMSLGLVRAAQGQGRRGRGAAAPGVRHGRCDGASPDPVRDAAGADPSSCATAAARGEADEFDEQRDGLLAASP